MKILLIRFSSFGDVLQTLSVLGRLHADTPEAEIHWVTREEFAPLIARHPGLHRVWTLPRKSSLKDLWSLAGELEKQRFTHIYDAHNNLRSRVLMWRLNGIFRWRIFFGRHLFLRRSIFRLKRFLLFQFRINLFPQPFSGQGALLEPLKKWGLSVEAPAPPQLFLPIGHRLDSEPSFTADRHTIALAASAAYALKRWPLEHWAELIRLLPHRRFVLLGGPEDEFLRELERVDPSRVINLAGKLSLLESAQTVAECQGLITNDTGLMHVAEQLGKPCIALMGPAPFGFPSRGSTRIMQVDLKCRPCSKHGQGPCVNPEFQKCLREISPSLVKDQVSEVFGVQ